MKHMHGILIGSLLLLVRPPAPAAAQQHYPLACRGPLSLFVSQQHVEWRITSHLLILPIVASPTAAGLRVDGLPPGTCAWLDRPLRGDEPRELRISFDLMELIDGIASPYPDPLEAMVVSCTASPACVVVLMARAVQGTPPVGVTVDSGNGYRQGMYPSLWAMGHNGDVYFPPMAFVRLDSPARPDLRNMTEESTVRVVTPPGDSVAH